MYFVYFGDGSLGTRSYVPEVAPFDFVQGMLSEPSRIIYINIKNYFNRAIKLNIRPTNIKSIPQNLIKAALSPSFSFFFTDKKIKYIPAPNQNNLSIIAPGLIVTSLVLNLRTSFDGY